MSALERYGPVTALRLGRPLPLLGRALMEVRCYAVDGLLVDAGLASRRDAVLGFARAHGVRRAALTHHHEDHTGNARALGDAGLEVVASEGTAARLREGWSLRAYQHLLWGAAPRARVTTPLFLFFRFKIVLFRDASPKSIVMSPPVKLRNRISA